MKYQNIREEELKNKVAKEYFWLYDCTKIIGNVDFCVSMHQSDTPLFEQESILWAEAKKGSADLHKSLVQLILTIGKARTFDTYLPPALLGAFDAEKIAFIPYNDIHDIFYLNDFNWNVTPSQHNTKEFQLVYQKVKNSLEEKSLMFDYEKDDKELRRFIKDNFVAGKYGLTKTRIDKNNFMVIYNKWLQTVKPTIAVKWELVKKIGVIDGDFYLADLLSQENETLKDSLFVLLQKDHYELERQMHENGLFTSSKTAFTDKQKAHTQFWNKYERPPKEEYWDYIIKRRDLLVPQDVRERKGSFFTPQIWVELSQKYLTDVLGEDWQDEYYIWDCAAGTGNLLAGLTNKYHVWASTLDRQDVEVMKDRIQNGANLLEDHVFQFDFLNDDFSKLPKDLQAVINDPEKRKKLVVYINPPYAEAGNAKQKSGTGTNKDGTTVENKTYEKYKAKIGKASNELFTQFFIRVYEELNGCILAEFSKLKLLQSSNFAEFRKVFQAKLAKLFLVPADTFDNVKGKFPIGFFIWNTSVEDYFKRITADVFDKNAKKIRRKKVHSYDNEKGKINTWLSFVSKDIVQEDKIGTIHSNSNDFQHQNDVFIDNTNTKKTFGGLHIPITNYNLKQVSILLAVRHCIEATWLNDLDQFLYPNKKWEKDTKFQNDCLAFTLFHGQNRITSEHGTNHWIPFTEYEVDSREKFESNFMTDFIKGKIKSKSNGDIFGNGKINHHALEFSAEAQAVFEAGKALWKYYHASIKKILGISSEVINASLYDIRAYFQGRNAKGRMNSRSDDEKYTELIGNLREALKVLAQKIEPKVYEYGFLK